MCLLPGFSFYRRPSLKGPESCKSFITSFTYGGNKSQHVKLLQNDMDMDDNNITEKTTLKRSVKNPSIN